MSGLTVCINYFLRLKNPILFVAVGVQIALVPFAIKIILVLKNGYILYKRLLTFMIEIFSMLQSKHGHSSMCVRSHSSRCQPGRG